MSEKCTVGTLVFKQIPPLLGLIGIVSPAYAQDCGTPIEANIRNIIMNAGIRAGLEPPAPKPKMYQRLARCMAKLRPGMECLQRASRTKGLPTETTTLFTGDSKNSASIWIDRGPAGEMGIYTLSRAGIFFHSFPEPDRAFHGTKRDDDHGTPRVFSLTVPFTKSVKEEVKLFWSALALAVPGTVHKNGKYDMLANYKLWPTLGLFEIAPKSPPEFTGTTQYAARSEKKGYGFHAETTVDVTQAPQMLRRYREWLAANVGCIAESVDLETQPSTLAQLKKDAVETLQSCHGIDRELDALIGTEQIEISKLTR